MTELGLRLPAQLGSPVPAPWAPLELELVVPACGNLGLGGRQLWLGRRYAGTRVRLWIDHQVIHLSTDGQLVKTVASQFTRAELPRLTQLGARPAGPPPPTTQASGPSIPGAVECDRLVNAAGLIGLGGRQVSVGQHHAGHQVTIRLDTHLAQVLLDGVLIKTMPSPVPASRLATSKAPAQPPAHCEPPRARRWFSGGSPAKAISGSPARSSRSARPTPAPRSPSWSTTIGLTP